jgi:hypothetical protein
VVAAAQRKRGGDAEERFLRDSPYDDRASYSSSSACPDMAADISSLKVADILLWAAAVIFAVAASFFGWLWRRAGRKGERSEELYEKASERLQEALQHNIQMVLSLASSSSSSGNTYSDITAAAGGQGPPPPPPPAGGATAAATTTTAAATAADRRVLFSRSGTGASAFFGGAAGAPQSTLVQQDQQDQTSGTGAAASIRPEASRLSDETLEAVRQVMADMAEFRQEFRAHKEAEATRGWLSFYSK